MASLLFRDIKEIDQIPVREFEHKTVQINKSLFSIYKDGCVWDIALGRWRVPDIDCDGYRIFVSWKQKL